MKKLWTRIQTHFMSKMTLMACLFLLIPGIIILIATYQINYRSLQAQLLTFNQQTLETSGLEWQESMQAIADIPLALYDADPAALKALRSTAAYEREQQEKIAAVLSSMLAGNSGVMGIDITGNNGETVREYRFISQSRWQTYAEASSFNEGFQVYLLNDSPYFGVYRHTAIDYPATDSLAVINVYFSFDAWNTQAYHMDGNENGHTVVLLNAQGQLLYQHGKAGSVDAGLASSDHMIYEGRFLGTNGYYLVRKLSVNHEIYRLIHFFPLSEITETIRTIVAPLLFFDVFLMICMIVYLAMVYGNLLRPIRHIVSNMKKVQSGVYQYTAHSKSLDEIGKMDRQYEKMVGHIDFLINQKMRHEMEIIKTKLKVLQAQINPHFLNNVLQMISTQAMCEGAEETDKMICSLARLLEYNMEVDHDVVYLEEEFRNIEHYLKLQNERYNGKIIATIEHGEECRQLHVPKMILQPLVENAIKYSRLKEGETCHITVRSQIHDGRIHLSVADDGEGISPERKQQIAEMYENNELVTSEGHGIGLLNVLLRLRLFFEGSFDWDAISDSHGCTIQMILPMDENTLHEKSGVDA